MRHHCNSLLICPQSGEGRKVLLALHRNGPYSNLSHGSSSNWSSRNQSPPDSPPDFSWDSLSMRQTTTNIFRRKNGRFFDRLKKRFVISFSRNNPKQMENYSVFHIWTGRQNSNAGVVLPPALIWKLVIDKFDTREQDMWQLCCWWLVKCCCMITQTDKT